MALYDWNNDGNNESVDNFILNIRFIKIVLEIEHLILGALHIGG